MRLFCPLHTHFHTFSHFIPPMLALQCEQLCELLELMGPTAVLSAAATRTSASGGGCSSTMPPSPSSPGRVEVVTLFWARCTDRAQHWTDVMRQLGQEEQVGGIFPPGS